jgi:hypothetical protein
MTISETMEKLMNSVPKDFKSWDHGKVIRYKFALSRAAILYNKWHNGKTVKEAMVQEAIKHLSGFYD